VGFKPPHEGGVAPFTPIHTNEIRYIAILWELFGGLGVKPPCGGVAPTPPFVNHLGLLYIPLIPMSIPEGFKSYYENTLLPELEPLELKRKAVVRKLLLIILFVIIVDLLFFLGLWLFVRYNQLFAVFSMTLGFLVVYISMLIPAGMIASSLDEYKSIFRTKVISPIIHLFDQDLNCFPRLGIDQRHFIKSRIFRFSQTASFQYCGENLLRGKVKDISFSCSEILANVKEKHHSPRGGARTYVRTVFQGLFWVAHVDNVFLDYTIIGSRVFLPLFRFSAGIPSGIPRINRMNMNRVNKLSYRQFERLFKVLSNNEEQSRCLLSIDLMQRIVNFRKKSRNQFIFHL
jgi:hypothetical protein